MADDNIYIKDKKKHSLLLADFNAKYKEVTLPPEYGHFVQDNMLMFTFLLARYKFIARNLRRQDKVLEIGCGSGLGSIFLSQHCKSVKGIDVQKHKIEYAKNLSRHHNVNFENIDFFHYLEDEKYDVIVALDVIEHMTEALGCKLIKKAAKHLRRTGMFVIGTPSRYSYKYEGKLSQLAHVKLYDQQEFIKILEKYYGRVISFSMNDEIVHTGFSKMAWYYFFLAFIPEKTKIWARRK